MKKLEGKVAMITGGTGGLGKSVMLEFLEQGASVICPYVNETDLKVMSDTMDNYPNDLVLVKGNTTKEKPIKKIVASLVKRFDKIDILINIVGSFKAGELIETSIDDLDKMYDLNLKSTYVSCKAVVPYMIKQKQGKIINVGAKPGITGSSGFSAYAASKAGVLNLTESLSDELLKNNINVNAVVPGTIDTPANRKAMPKAKFSNWVKPEEIAKIMVFLSSDDAEPISGAIIPVFGKAYLG